MAPRLAPMRCWSARARKSASSRRRAFAIRSRCAAATGRIRGVCGATSRPSRRERCGSKCPSAHWPTARSARPVDIAAVHSAARALLAEGAEALAIVFINAYANPANERAAYEAAVAVWPNPHVVHSAQILPEIREFERTSTTALNAYLQPVVATYLSKLEEASGGGAICWFISHRAVQWRRDVDCDRAALSRAHSVVWSRGWRHRRCRDRPRCRNC